MSEKTPGNKKKENSEHCDVSNVFYDHAVSRLLLASVVDLRCLCICDLPSVSQLAALLVGVGPFGARLRRGS